VLTFDSRHAPPDELKELLKKPSSPDRVECGESNDYWIYVKRSTKQVELVSKQTGRIVANCTVELARDFGLRELQILAVKKALLRM
jgi:hypothetical protein